jgi:hypothetical protein
MIIFYLLFVKGYDVKIEKTLPSFLAKNLNRSSCCDYFQECVKLTFNSISSALL